MAIIGICDCDDASISSRVMLLSHSMSDGRAEISRAAGGWNAETGARFDKVGHVFDRFAFRRGDCVTVAAVVVLINRHHSVEEYGAVLRLEGDDDVIVIVAADKRVKTFVKETRLVVLVTALSLTQFVAQSARRFIHY